MKKTVITLLHTGYWLLYVLLLLLILICLQAGTGINKHPLFFNYRFNVFLSALAIVPAVVGFYFSYSILFTRFLSKKKLLLFFAGVAAASLAGSLAGSVCLSLLHWSNIGIGVFNEGMASALPALITMCIIAFLNGAVGLVMKGFISWYNDIKLKEELTQKNHTIELALVKSQLDPHFLFNTLNNIDVLIEKNPATASVYLKRLSHIMRFMLYETKAERIPLQKELEYIEKYIELQRIRNANPEYVLYKKEISNSNLSIAPMVFIPFIENAFKHSAGKKDSNSVSIHFAANGDTVIFECENFIAGNNGLHREDRGLGNDLIQKRLKLLYKDKYRLDINNESGKYNVKLQIDCK